MRNTTYNLTTKEKKKDMIADYELIDFVRDYKRPKQKYESYSVFTMALTGKFYGRIGKDAMHTLLDRCKHLGLLYILRNGNIRFL